MAGNERAASLKFPSYLEILLDVLGCNIWLPKEGNERGIFTSLLKFLDVSAVWHGAGGGGAAMKKIQQWLLSYLSHKAHMLTVQEGPSRVASTRVYSELLSCSVSSFAPSTGCFLLLKQPTFYSVFLLHAVVPGANTSPSLWMTFSFSWHCLL